VLKIPPASNKALAKAADKFLHKSSGFQAAFANAQPLPATFQTLNFGKQTIND